MASVKAKEWGFPRHIEAFEVFDGHWFYMGDALIYWLQEVPGFPEDFAIHVVVSPDHRMNWPVRRWLQNVRVTAELLGAKRVRAVVKPPIDDYLERVGWESSVAGGHVWDLT